MKKKNNINVVLLDGDGVQTLIMAERLYRNGYAVFALCEVKCSYGYHTRYAHTDFCPSIRDRRAYKQFFIEYVGKNHIDVAIPMGDKAAAFLSSEKESLLQIVHFVIPDWNVFNRGYDKQQLMDLCAEYGFPHPRTINLEEDRGAAADFVYPALIKPNHTCGGRGMTFVRSYEDFLEKYDDIRLHYGACHLQEFIPPGGGQIEVQVFVGEENELLASSVIYKYRFFPESGGSSCCNVTIQNDELAQMCYQVALKLGWKGLADFDMIEDLRDGVVKFMELNPRVPACVKSAIMSGPDYSELIVRASLGLPQRKYDYRPGASLRYIGFEVMWFLQSKNRFRTRPNWFRFWGKRLYFQDFSWSDPLPFFFGTMANVRKLFNPDFLKSKSGLR